MNYKRNLVWRLTLEMSLKNVIAVCSQLLAIKVSLTLGVSRIRYDELWHTYLCKDVCETRQYFSNDVLTSESVYKSQMWNGNNKKFRMSCVFGVYIFSAYLILLLLHLFLKLNKWRGEISKGWNVGSKSSRGEFLGWKIRRPFEPHPFG